MQNTEIGFSIENPNISRTDTKILYKLAENISTWHSNPQFLRFLKEVPQTKEKLFKILQEEVDNESNQLFIIRQESDFIGYVLFHNFQSETGEIEISVRVDPKNQRSGICTQAVKESVQQILFHSKKIQIINSWHSAWNQGTFRVNLRNGFKIRSFIPENTFLPNLGEITDDFHWQLTKENLLIPQTPSIIHTQADLQNILDGLNKHNLPNIRA